MHTLHLPHFYIQRKFAEVEVNSGRYLPSRFGEVTIHCYSLALRRITVFVKDGNVVFLVWSQTLHDDFRSIMMSNAKTSPLHSLLNNQFKLPFRASKVFWDFIIDHIIIIVWIFNKLNCLVTKGSTLRVRIGNVCSVCQHLHLVVPINKVQKPSISFSPVLLWTARSHCLLMSSRHRSVKPQNVLVFKVLGSTYLPA